MTPMHESPPPPTPTGADGSVLSLIPDHESELCHCITSQRLPGKMKRQDSHTNCALPASETGELRCILLPVTWRCSLGSILSDIADVRFPQTLGSPATWRQYLQEIQLVSSTILIIHLSSRFIVRYAPAGAKIWMPWSLLLNGLGCVSCGCRPPFLPPSIVNLDLFYEANPSIKSSLLISSCPFPNADHVAPFP